MRAFLLAGLFVLFAIPALARDSTGGSGGGERPYAYDPSMDDGSREVRRDSLAHRVVYVPEPAARNGCFRYFRTAEEAAYHCPVNGFPMPVNVRNRIVWTCHCGQRE